MRSIYSLFHVQRRLAVARVLPGAPRLRTGCRTSATPDLAPHGKNAVAPGGHGPSRLSRICGARHRGDAQRHARRGPHGLARGRLRPTALPGWNGTAEKYHRCTYSTRSTTGSLPLGRDSIQYPAMCIDRTGVCTGPEISSMAP
jgi:hypothetical protein